MWVSAYVSVRLCMGSSDVGVGTSSIVHESFSLITYLTSAVGWLALGNPSAQLPKGQAYR